MDSIWVTFLIFQFCAQLVFTTTCNLLLLFLFCNFLRWLLVFFSRIVFSCRLPFLMLVILQQHSFRVTFGIFFVSTVLRFFFCSLCDLLFAKSHFFRLPFFNLPIFLKAERFWDFLLHFFYYFFYFLV